MNTQVLVVLLVTLIVVVAAAWWYAQRRRHAHLRSRFGPEYERTVREAGNIARAESILTHREQRVDRLHLRPLTGEEKTRFSDEWRRVQSQFVDDPKGTLTEADRLITEVMSTRGYPMGNWEQRVADVSVDYPLLCDHYRTGHDIAIRNEHGEASTEDLRRAMVEYRALFTELVGAGEIVSHGRQRRAG
jgi:hypothetical protein